MSQQLATIFYMKYFTLSDSRHSFGNFAILLLLLGVIAIFCNTLQPCYQPINIVIQTFHEQATAYNTSLIKLLAFEEISAGRAF